MIRGLLTRFGPEHAGTSPAFFTFLTVSAALEALSSWQLP